MEPQLSEHKDEVPPIDPSPEVQKSENPLVPEASLSLAQSILSDNPPSVNISTPHQVEKPDPKPEPELSHDSSSVPLVAHEESKQTTLLLTEEKPKTNPTENLITIVQISPTGFDETINIPIEINPSLAQTTPLLPISEDKHESQLKMQEDLLEEEKNQVLIEIEGQMNILQSECVEIAQQMEHIPKNEDEGNVAGIIAGVNELVVQDELEPPPPPPVLFREPSSSDPEAPDSQHNYFQHLGAYRVQMSDWDEGITSSYIYDNSDLSQEGLNRVNKEIKALTRSLPCEPSGAVFLHIDSSNLSRMKAIISGTEDTPYEHGLYLFDIKLDANYPSTPPKMTIKTTGNGILRFNPNLYDSGYVCLSIINTWGGDPEEMWNPSYSTLMQVFLSIQALVMNNDVIQKEPGYEDYATNGPENRDYMTIVKYGNIMFAMTDMLRNPPVEFKEIIQKHFSLKKEKILLTVEKWLGDLEGVGQGFNDCIVSSHNSSTIGVLSERSPTEVFQQIYTDLKAELEKIPDLT